MPESGPESKRGGTPTEYFDISHFRQELKGNLVGEILNEHGKPTLHLSIRPEQRMSKQGSGDIVILNISRLGWEKIGGVVASLGPDATMVQVSNALTQQDFITWDRPSNGR